MSGGALTIKMRDGQRNSYRGDDTRGLHRIRMV